LPRVIEHKVLPNHNPQFIVDVVELLRFVIAAPPKTNHVHVGILDGLQNVTGPFHRGCIGKFVERNDICAFGEDRDSIYHKFKRLSPLVGIAPEHDRTEPRAHRASILDHSTYGDVRVE